MGTVLVSYYNKLSKRLYMLSFKRINISIIQDINNINETVKTILNILNSKHQNNIDKIIKSIKLYKRTKLQHPKLITFIHELSDGRIAVGCIGGTISLNQMNYETKEWITLTQRNKAHNDKVTSLCEISKTE